MAERGIDLTNEYPKPWGYEILKAADVVITMGCDDAPPILPGPRYEDWALDDPDGKDVAAVRPIRDEIEGRVRRLVDELLDEPASEPPRCARRSSSNSSISAVIGIRSHSTRATRHRAEQ